MIYTWYISVYSLRIEHQFHEFLLGILCKLTFLSFPHFFFRNYFENCCHVKVPGRLFPIQEYYLEDILINVNNSSSENHKNKTRVDESETVMIRKNPQNPQNSLFSALGVTK